MKYLHIKLSGMSCDMFMSKFLEYLWYVFVTILHDACFIAFQLLKVEKILDFMCLSKITKIECQSIFTNFCILQI